MNLAGPGPEIDDSPQAECSLDGSIGKSESRLRERMRARCWVSLSYRGRSGGRRRIWGRTLDMSASGALIASLMPIDIGSCVLIRANELLAKKAYTSVMVRVKVGNTKSALDLRYLSKTGSKPRRDFSQCSWQSRLPSLAGSSGAIASSYMRRMLG
jgi:hypothetical protein